MRTITLRTVAGLAIALLGTLVATAAAPAFAADAGTPATAPAPASNTVTPADDRIFELRLDAGYRLSEDEQNSRLLPYEPTGNGPIFGLDLIYLTPGFGSLHLDSGYVTDETWQAAATYNHSADLRLEAGTQSFTHAREHLDTFPTLSGVIMTVGSDADPDRTYRSDLQETEAALRFRIPGYPAHLSASGRVYNHRGTEQMRYFYRGCSTNSCHQNSRSRDLDQQTQEYTLGLDTHVGPVDLAYSHTVRTFSDDAADPVVSAPGMPLYVGGLPPGDHKQDVDPDQRSASDRLSLNTNQTNRLVLSMTYTGAEQDNQSADISRSTRTAGATMSYRMTPSAFLVGSYNYDDQRSGETGASALAQLAANNAAHTASSWNHVHLLEPERTRNTGELKARFSPIEKAEVALRVRYRSLTRRSILEKEGTAYIDETGTMKSTLVSLDGNYRVTSAISFDAKLGQEWSDNPAYATEATSATRYELGGRWTPSPVFLFRATWQGYLGKNDEVQSLAAGYPAAPDRSNPERTVEGNAIAAMASYIPAPTFSLTASWNLIKNGVDQDLVFGSPAEPAYSYLSPDTGWDGRYQVADLRARCVVTKRLILTAGGSWIESLESYRPTFREGAELEDISRIEFTKLLGSLAAEVRVTDAVGLNIAAFLANYNDRTDNSGDQTAQGLLAAVEYKW